VVLPLPASGEREYHKFEGEGAGGLWAMRPGFPLSSE